MLRYTSFLLVLGTVSISCTSAQTGGDRSQSDRALRALIADYSQARETQDTTLLKSILTDDIDQLVSTGEWRVGLGTALAGMVRSTAGNPGTRSLDVERIKYLTPGSAVVDARYVIRNDDDSAERRMWSTFVAVRQQGRWRIAAIRNMKPAD